MSWRTKFLTPKVGDTVICIVNENRSIGNKGDRDGYGAGWKKGKKFVIRKLDSKIAWPLGKDSGLGIYKDCIRCI